MRLAGLLARPELILEKLPQNKAAIVTNATVAPLYLASLKGALESRGVNVVSVTVPDGEAYKTWETLNRIFDTLLEHPLVSVEGRELRIVWRRAGGVRPSSPGNRTLQEGEPGHRPVQGTTLSSRRLTGPVSTLLVTVVVQQGVLGL